MSGQRTIDDGGPAFSPGPCSIRVRDYFAAQALQGILASFADEQLPDENKAARWAYEYADAMLRARAALAAARETP
jgi:hypothetical protein